MTHTMVITVNGEERTLAVGTTVAELVATMVRSDRGVAVAVDREIVPRSAWPDWRIGSGAAVEVLGAAAGG
jgi:sulfur carrier protein